MTLAMDALRPYEATRALAKLLEDVSQWYVRRIRDRARNGNVAALTTLRLVLMNCARLIAPFAPFIAEDIYQQLRTSNDVESIHLAEWPQGSVVVDGDSIEAMSRLRSLASQALMLRNKANIPVRQPLASLTIAEQIPFELHALLAEEVNVEQIIEGEKLALDFELTDDLRAKGDERAFQRAVAEARKAEGLSLKDTVRVERRADGPHEVELSKGSVRFLLVRE